MSPIEEIVRSDNLELLKCVYKPKLNTLRESGVYGLIHHAAGVPDSKCLRMMLTIGISPNEPCNDTDRALPLHFSAISDCISNAELLLSKGANVTAVDCAGNSAMHLAVSNKSLEFIRLLDSNGADASLENKDGVSAIMMALGDADLKLHFKS